MFQPTITRGKRRSMHMAMVPLTAQRELRLDILNENLLRFMIDVRLFGWAGLPLSSPQRLFFTDPAEG